MSNLTDDSTDPAIRYWRKYFHCDPTPLERRLFKIARRYLSPADPYLFYFALVTHVHSLVYLDADKNFMADAAVSRDLAKQICSNYEGLSSAIPLFEKRLEQLEFLADRTGNLIRGFEHHEERLSFWNIKPEELPIWSLLIVNGMFLLFFATALLLFVVP
jgi:hypothetical protein